jgi:hypothetical protein
MNLEEFLKTPGPVPHWLMALSIVFLLAIAFIQSKWWEQLLDKVLELFGRGGEAKGEKKVIFHDDGNPVVGVFLKLPNGKRAHADPDGEVIVSNTICGRALLVYQDDPPHLMGKVVINRTLEPQLIDVRKEIHRQ